DPLPRTRPWLAGSFRPASFPSPLFGSPGRERLQRSSSDVSASVHHCSDRSRPQSSKTYIKTEDYTSHSGQQPPRLSMPVDLGLEPFIYVALAVIFSNADCVADRFGVRPAVANNGDSFHADERSATVFSVVQPLLEPLKCGPGEQGARLGLKR